MNEPTISTTTSSTTNVSVPVPAAPPIYIPNDYIACSPPASRSLEKQGTKGFVTAKQAVELLPLKVVFGAAAGKHPYNPGDTVWIRGAATTLTWTKEKYDLGGELVILVPASEIQAWQPVPVPWTGIVQGPAGTQITWPWSLQPTPTPTYPTMPWTYPYQPGTGIYRPTVVGPDGVVPLTVGDGVAPLTFEPGKIR